MSPATGPECTPGDDRPDPTDVEEYDHARIADAHEPDCV